MSSSQTSREIVFHPNALDDLRYWAGVNRKVLVRVFDLVESVMRDPFSGLGKPEPLKGELQGAWSRRITSEHRLVYKVRDGRVEFLQARYHYKK